MAVAVMEQGDRAGSVAPAVKARMETFVAQVAGAAMSHPVQRSNAEVYVRGLLAAGARKSLEPLVERLDGDGDYWFSTYAARRSTVMIRGAWSVISR